MRLVHSDDGNTLIEIALFLPVLITMFLGVLDFGFLLQQYMTVVDSARAATEVALVRNYATISGANSTYLVNIAKSSAQGIPNYSATATNYCTCGAGSSIVACGNYLACGVYGQPAQYVKVVATASLPVLFGVTGFPTTINVQSTSIVRTAWTD